MRNPSLSRLLTLPPLLLTPLTAAVEQYAPLPAHPSAIQTPRPNDAKLPLPLGGGQPRPNLLLMRRAPATPTCPQAYGPGFIACGAGTGGSGFCFNPSAGQKCCPLDGGFCEKGTYCAPVAGYCCPDNEDIANCARNAGFQLPPVLAAAAAAATPSTGPAGPPPTSVLTTAATAASLPAAVVLSAATTSCNDNWGQSGVGAAATSASNAAPPLPPFVRVAWRSSSGSASASYSLPAASAASAASAFSPAFVSASAPEDVALGGGGAISSSSAVGGALVSAASATPGVPGAFTGGSSSSGNGSAISGGVQLSEAASGSGKRRAGGGGGGGGGGYAGSGDRFGSFRVAGLVGVVVALFW